MGSCELPLTRLGLCLTALFLSAGLMPAQNLSIGVSDLFPESLIQKIQTQAQAAGLDLQMDAAGSVRAWDAFDAGSADLILVAQVDNPESAAGVVTSPFAFQLSVVAVTANNPVASIDYRQLQEIFASGGRADLWGRYVDEEERAWRSRPISPHAVRQEDLLNFGIFSQHVLAGREPRSHVRFHSNQSSAVNRLRAEPGGIALLPSPLVGSHLRILPVALSEEHPAVYPSPENVLSGDYALRLPFYLYWRDSSEQRDELGTVLSILFSDDISRELEQLGWMPLDASRRAVFRK